MAYSNGAMVIHGTGAASYNQPPTFSMNINVSDVSRNGSILSCSVTASLNSFNTSHYFGYTVKVFAKLDDGGLVQLIDKGSSPNRWGDGYGGLGTQVVSSTNMTASCTLHLYMQSDCGCHGNTLQLITSIAMNAPSAVKCTLTLKKGTGVSEFSGSGTYDQNAEVTTTAVAASGYKLTKYVGTAGDGSIATWTDCAGLTTRKDTWTMVRDRTIAVYAAGNTYNISYNANGGTGKMSKQSVTYGESVTPRTNAFKRANFKFKGWNTKADGSGTNRNSAWTYKTVGNTTLYAQWSRIPYTVTYDANGGTNPPANQTKYAGVALTLTSSKPSPKKIRITFDPSEGTVSPTSTTRSCGFLRWNTQANGKGTNYNSGGKYTADASITLYAQWSSVSTTLPTPTRSQCVFVGWFSAKSGGSEITTSTTFKKDTTIYARWDYKVKYHLNGGYLGDSREGGDGVIATDIKHHDETLTLTGVKPKKEGLVFKGWAETASATEPKYKSKGKYTNNEPIVLYAVYGVPTYTVKFDLRGGTYQGGGALTQIVERGKDAVLPNNPIKPEHDFRGWVGSHKNITHNVTIYALWNGCPIWILESDKKWHSYVKKLQQ